MDDGSPAVSEEIAIKFTRNDYVYYLDDPVTQPTSLPTER